MVLYICRHGDKQSDSHESRLSKRGHMHAMYLGHAIMQRRVVNPYILSSPYDRCLQTATAIAKQVNANSIFVEHGLCEGPLHIPGTMSSIRKMKEKFPLINMHYLSCLREPCGEQSQLDVLPRCQKMSKYISKLNEYIAQNLDIVIVTHGTVAIGMVAALMQTDIHEIGSIPGCCPAGYYTLKQVSRARWAGDCICNSDHLPSDVAQRGTRTTPICLIRGQN